MPKSSGITYLSVCIFQKFVFTVEDLNFNQRVLYCFIVNCFFACKRYSSIRSSSSFYRRLNTEEMEAEDNIQKMYKYFGILADAKENIAEVSEELNFNPPFRLSHGPKAVDFLLHVDFYVAMTHFIIIKCIVFIYSYTTINVKSITILTNNEFFDLVTFYHHLSQNTMLNLPTCHFTFVFLVLFF